MSLDTDDDVGPSLDQTPAGWSGYVDTYDEWLAPITRRFAMDAVSALDVRQGTRLIDVGAGSGALTIAAARAGAAVLATDFAPGMVELLRRRLTTAGLTADVELMDGQSLTVADGRFDVAASMFGLIFFPDVAAGACELRRVLRLGGRAAVTAWGPDGFAIQGLALAALTRVGVVDPAGWTTSAAFRLSDPARLEALLVDAGFFDVVVRQLQHALRIPDPEALFRSIPGWSAPMRPLFARLDDAQLRDGAAAFRVLVRERSGDDGLLLTALLATGSR